jgi:hypothetical protein
MLLAERPMRLIMPLFVNGVLYFDRDTTLEVVSSLHIGCIVRVDLQYFVQLVDKIPDGC